MAYRTQNLVQILPLSQSRFEAMRCAHSYAEQFISGRRQAPSMASARGTEVHSVLARYINHCVYRQVEADFAQFDILMGTVGEESAAICERMRDTYRVNHAASVFTEQRLMLDAQLQPTTNKAESAHEGTLDHFLVLNDTVGLIEDFKSHPQPFEPDTYQGALYPLLIFRTYPHLQEVRFELVFVRYGARCRRQIVWKRADLPELVARVTRARARQEAITDQAILGQEPLSVTPGPHCIYCPMLTDGSCPERENPYGAMEIGDRVLFAEWLRRQQAANNQILRDWVKTTEEPVMVRDEEGDTLSFGWHEAESTVYPVLETAAILKDYHAASGEDPFAWKGVRIAATGLKSKLNTKKRLALKEQIDAVATKEAKVKLQLLAPNRGQSDAHEEDED